MELDGPPRRSVSVQVLGVSTGGPSVKVKMILPALTEAVSPFFRPIKYSLFPPLGLATLAGYLGEEDEVSLQDEHVERLALDDKPDLVVIQVHITSARRAYRLADHYRGRAPSWRSAACTSRPFPRKPPVTPTASSFARRPGRAASAAETFKFRLFA